MQPISCETCGHEVQEVCHASKRMDCLNTYPGIKCNGHRCFRCCIRERTEALTGKNTRDP